MNSNDFKPLKSSQMEMGFKVFALMLIPILLGVSISNSFAAGSSSVIITNPANNQAFNTNIISVSGTYTSPNSQVTLIVTVDKTNYTQYPTTGTFNSGSITLPDGWHDLKVTITDTNGITSTHEQFMTSLGHIKVTKYALIVPMYSEVCARMIKVHDYSSCPPLSELMPYDTSNQNVAGTFVLQKDGTYIRTHPQSKNFFQFYTNMTDKKVCVECPINLMVNDVVQTIFIEPKGGFSYTQHEFVTENESNSFINSTVSVNYINAGMIIHHNRFVDTTCNNANISWSKELFIDTINYLKSGCTITQINDTMITQIPSHEVDYEHAPQIVYNKYVSDSLKANKGDCITQSCETVKNPQNKFTGIWNTSK